MLLFWPILIMLHFYTKNASEILQRTYTVGVKTWKIKNIGTLHTFHFLQISAGVGALSIFKMLANSCWACSDLISVLSGPSDDVIQVVELNAIGMNIHVVLKLWSRGMQLDHTLFFQKSCFMLALCHDLKAADYAQNYAQNYAGRVLASLVNT